MPDSCIKTSAALSVGSTHRISFLHWILRPLPWASFPGHHSGITNTSLIGELPTAQDRCCIFSPSLVALCMLLPSLLPNKWKTSSVSRVRSAVCGCGFQCVRGKGILEMPKRSKGSNSVEHIPSMSKALVEFRAPEMKTEKGCSFCMITKLRLPGDGGAHL